jgi:hypothetical protein
MGGCSGEGPQPLALLNRRQRHHDQVLVGLDANRHVDCSSQWSASMATSSEGLAGPAVEAGGDLVELLLGEARRFVPCGRYWRSSPLVSFVPRCQGVLGSQK